MYLLDTNIISETRKPRPHAGVLAWLREVPSEQLYLSAVTLGELQSGVELTREQDASKADEIERWIDSVPSVAQVLAMDTDVFRTWARLMHRRPNQLAMDAMIAATAVVHGLTVATRNVRDFEVFGVSLVNPFEP
ncbi:MAG TPA: type II toxin-antitoxin system VapC family toxin [Chloroflexota bacterium]|nr:type II toxin-antitoxin system VapC family toxin [Chloroflexota bacterium]